MPVVPVSFVGLYVDCRDCVVLLATRVGVRASQCSCSVMFVSNFLYATVAVITQQHRQQLASWAGLGLAPSVQQLQAYQPRLQVLE